MGTETRIGDKHETHWITISLDEYESMKSTLEILSDPRLKEEALEGKRQAKEGMTEKLESVLEELNL